MQTLIKTNQNKTEYIYIRDFRLQKIIRDKEEHDIMTKMSICREDLTVLSIYIPKIKLHSIQSNNHQN